jgi:hypothetical protein
MPALGLPEAAGIVAAMNAPCELVAVHCGTAGTPLIAPLIPGRTADVPPTLPFLYNKPVCLPVPDAIPVAKGNDGLRRRLSAATVELMMVSVLAGQFPSLAPAMAAQSLPRCPKFNPPCLVLLCPMQEGNNSPLLEWEKEYLTDKGVLSYPNLAAVVHAVSYFESTCGG